MIIMFNKKKKYIKLILGGRKLKAMFMSSLLFIRAGLSLLSVLIKILPMLSTKSIIKLHSYMRFPSIRKASKELYTSK